MTMKKSFFSLLVLMVVLSCSKNSNPALITKCGIDNLYIDYELLSGKVKKLTVNQHQANSDSEEIAIGLRVRSDVYKFNDTGNVIEKIAFGVDQELFGKSTAEYKDGKLIKVVVYDGENNQNSIHKYEYEQGKLINVSGQNPSGEIYYQYQIQTDGDCSIPLRMDEITEKGGYISRVIDESICKTVKRTDYDKNEYLSQKWEFEYDKNGLLVKEVYSGKDGSSISVFKYSDFDENKNWTQKEITTDGVLKYVIEREIEYY